MRRGYTLLEIISLVGIFALIFALSARPIRIMAREAPYIRQMYDLQQEIDFFCGQLQRDVEAADAIHATDAGGRAGDRVLYLHTSGGWVAWQIRPGWALRVEETENAEPDRSWNLKHAELKWSLYEANGRPAGVEVRSWINRPLLGRQEMKFRQSRLFFMGVREETL